MIQLLGIDPGVTTGVALWNTDPPMLAGLESLSLHQALEQVHALRRAHEAENRNHATGIPCVIGTPLELVVIFEDARLRTWFGARDANQEKYGAGVREGAGSVKRDCVIWEEFLRDYRIPFIPRKPVPGATKWKAPYFKRLTGWEGRTNEHQRDAGALVWGINSGMAKSLLIQGRQRLEENPQ